ncbi:hypothetical protein [Prolixibacter sp. NT017]|uniref:hypothetical protein n=1 Tax=Prolixibacter sp. NT017 TaxID=2652390 RepID=UPI00128A324D|nr:hypothetical protein [Prolixibacter sp. NT017]GET25441.1 hypothetical protein NT017_17700 [Prolixibacter sp. NT017]
MKLFLKLKHWQIFLIWILGSIQALLFVNSDFWILSFVIYFGPIFGWLYAIGKVLNENDSGTVKKLNIWSVIFLISAVPYAIEYHEMLTRSSSSRTLNGLVLFLSAIPGLIAGIKICIISAKSLKEKEKQREQRFSDYLTEFILMLYMVIGVWIIQPRLNKIMKEN